MVPGETTGEERFWAKVWRCTLHAAVNQLGLPWHDFEEA